MPDPAKLFDRRRARAPMFDHEVDWNNSTPDATIAWRGAEGWELATASHRPDPDTWDLFWKRPA